MIFVSSSGAEIFLLSFLWCWHFLRGLRATVGGCQKPNYKNDKLIIALRSPFLNFPSIFLSLFPYSSVHRKVKYQTVNPCLDTSTSPPPATPLQTISPAVLASLHASYMSCLMSGLSSPILSATATNRSIARLTDCPTRPIARKAFSEATVAAPCCGCSDRCWTRVEIWKWGKGNRVS